MKYEWIIKYFSGEATAEERASIDKWRLEKSEHEQEFLNMKKIWQHSAEEHHVPEIDVDRAWTNFVRLRAEKQDVSGSPVVSSVRRYRLFSMVGKVAAALCIIGGGFLWYMNNRFSSELSLQTTAQVQRSKLPDGSTVTLNKRSSMDFRKAWLGNARSVMLQRGEVFFEVKRDTTTPFVVQSGPTRITVLGTSFHVRRGDQTTEIIVASGAVRVANADQEAILRPGEMLTIADTSKMMVAVKQVPDQLYRYYINQEFIFENTPLTRVFEVLGRAYDIAFVLDNPENGKLTLSASFKQQQLSEILNVILQTFDLKLEKKEDVFHVN